MKPKMGGALALLFVGAVAVSVLAWRITGPSRITAHGYVALDLCLAIGGGRSKGAAVALETDIPKVADGGQAEVSHKFVCRFRRQTR
jgi:hypothetical protein